MPDLLAALMRPDGASGGILGKTGGDLDSDLVGQHPDVARKLVTFGKYPRAGHNPARWSRVNWGDFQAQVGILGREGPWQITVADARAGTLSEKIHRWTAEALHMPWEPGVYTVLRHDQRGVVMSDVPCEIAGALPFLDHAATLGRRGRVLVAGLGLGIIPAWLLANTAVARIDVVEIDADLIRLVTGAARSVDGCWADSPRLRIVHADAHWWHPGRRHWDAGWLDIWDTVSALNLSSMMHLEARYGPRCDALWSWERPECEAMLNRDPAADAPVLAERLT